MSDLQIKRRDQIYSTGAFGARVVGRVKLMDEIALCCHLHLYFSSSTKKNGCACYCPHLHKVIALQIHKLGFSSFSILQTVVPKFCWFLGFLKHCVSLVMPPTIAFLSERSCADAYHLLTHHGSHLPLLLCSPLYWLRLQYPR